MARRTSNPGKANKGEEMESHKKGMYVSQNYQCKGMARGLNPNVLKVL
jgi:hypothetical protein